MTYSIIAVDTTTGEVGGAGTSCLEGGDVFVIYRGVPGRGAVHAQAFYTPAGRDRAAALLGSGQSASAALAAVTSPTFDEGFALRQYGVVDVAGAAVGFTGDRTTAFAADRQGRIGSFAYSVQGNILTSEAVLTQASSAFEAGGCDLAQRLFAALRAGAEHGEGDARCTPRGIPSDSAFLQVEAPNGAEGGYLSLHVASSGSLSPLPLLATKLDEWRADHPCPVKSMPSAPATTNEQKDSDGCACRFQRDAPSSFALALLPCLLLFGALVVRRRRRAAAREL